MSQSLIDWIQTVSILLVAATGVLHQWRHR
jgi:hypothetical protein